MAKGNPGLNQEPMIVASEEGHLQVRDFQSEATMSVDLIESTLHLENTIRIIGRISRNSGIDPAMHTAERERIIAFYGERGADRVASGAAAKIPEMQLQAKWEFARAFGRFAMEDAGMDAETAKQMTREEYELFDSEFAGPVKEPERKAFLKKLKNRVLVIQQGVTLRNRTAGNRPHKRDAEIAAESTEDRPAFMPSVQDRLRALHEDERAGFLPSTHQEKNVVLSWLDYLDNPKYPLGVITQLGGVMGSQRKLREHNKSINQMRGILSIVYEVGDYYSNAVHSLEVLRGLEGKIRACPNPAVTLREEIGEAHPGYAPLIRFLDLAQLRETGNVGGLQRDPLRTREDRWADGGSGKHKDVEDQYTAKILKPAFSKRIAKRIDTLTVGELRMSISEAIGDQEKRRAFHEQRLIEIASPQFHYGPKTAPKWVIAAENILLEHDQELDLAS
jgi:hypothetical protein